MHSEFKNDQLPILATLKSLKMVFRSILAIIAIVFCARMGMAQITQQRTGSFLFSLSAEEVGRTSLPTRIKGITLPSSKIITSEINYWNGAYPSYRWHQVMVEAGKRHKGHKNGGRMAMLHLAIYDALASADKNKARDLDERAVVAGAAYGIIGMYFPKQQQWLDSTLQRYRTIQINAFNKKIHDIDLAIGFGMAMANKYHEYAKDDNTKKAWTGKVPNNPKLWSGAPYKFGPTKRDWKPITLDSASQFRPVPPPMDWSADMQELRDFNATHKSSEIAWKWKSQPIWDELLERKILAYGLDTKAAAYVSALFHTARYDATIAAWDGKYHYWGIRPFQYDPEFRPILIETPNFPGYPAGHTTVAGALAVVLSHFFPFDDQQFYDLAIECAESRFEGGVHFRTDNEIGLEVGKKVGQHVIRVFQEKTNGERELR